MWDLTVSIILTRAVKQAEVILPKRKCSCRLIFYSFNLSSLWKTMCSKSGVKPELPLP